MSKILLNVVDIVGEKSIAWISLQPDGSISVGLSDKTFISPLFRSRNFLWNWDNQVTFEYKVVSSPNELEQIKNPHLTFHPPIKFHLTDSKNKLFEGICKPRLMLTRDEVVSWIRFVSSPINELDKIKSQRNDGISTIIEQIKVDSLNCSIGLGIDFVRPSFTNVTGLLYSRCFDIAEHRIHVFCEQLVGQISTLAWYHHH